MKSRKQSIRSRRAQRFKQFVEMEITSNCPQPPFHFLGLEMKRDELCLRLNDTIIAIAPGIFEITRTWMRPGKQPFDEAIYPRF